MKVPQPVYVLYMKMNQLKYQTEYDYMYVTV